MQMESHYSPCENLNVDILDDKFYDFLTKIGFRSISNVARRDSSTSESSVSANISKNPQIVGQTNPPSTRKGHLSSNKNTNEVPHNANPKEVGVQNLWRKNTWQNKCQDDSRNEGDRLSQSYLSQQVAPSDKDQTFEFSFSASHNKANNITVFNNPTSTTGRLKNKDAPFSDDNKNSFSVRKSKEKSDYGNEKTFDKITMLNLLGTLTDKVRNRNQQIFTDTNNRSGNTPSEIPNRNYLGGNTQSELSNRKNPGDSSFSVYDEQRLGSSFLISTESKRLSLHEEANSAILAHLYKTMPIEANEPLRRQSRRGGAPEDAISVQSIQLKHRRSSSASNHKGAGSKQIYHHGNASPASSRKSSTQPECPLRLIPSVNSAFTLLHPVHLKLCNPYKQKPLGKLKNDPDTFDLEIREDSDKMVKGEGGGFSVSDGRKSVELGTLVANEFFYKEPQSIDSGSEPTSIAVDSGEQDAGGGSQVSAMEQLELAIKLLNAVALAESPCLADGADTVLANMAAQIEAIASKSIGRKGVDGQTRSQFLRTQSLRIPKKDEVVARVLGQAPFKSAESNPNPNPTFKPSKFLNLVRPDALTSNSYNKMEELDKRHIASSEEFAELVSSSWMPKDHTTEPKAGLPSLQLVDILNSGQANRLSTGTDDKQSSFSHHSDQINKIIIAGKNRATQNYKTEIKVKTNADPKSPVSLPVSDDKHQITETASLVEEINLVKKGITGLKIQMGTPSFQALAPLAKMDEICDAQEPFAPSQAYASDRSTPTGEDKEAILEKLKQPDKITTSTFIPEANYILDVFEKSMITTESARRIDNLSEILEQANTSSENLDISTPLKIDNNLEINIGDNLIFNLTNIIPKSAGNTAQMSFTFDTLQKKKTETPPALETHRDQLAESEISSGRDSSHRVIQSETETKSLADQPRNPSATINDLDLDLDLSANSNLENISNQNLYKTRP